MLTFVSIVHVLLCVFMIFVILLQPGKDAGMGSTLGGGAATTAFGGRGAVTFLGKLTAICAVTYFLTSLGLSFVGSRSTVADAIAAPVPVQLPSLPAALPGMGDGGTMGLPGATDAVQTTPPEGAKALPAGAAPGTEAVPADKLPPPGPQGK